LNTLGLAACQSAYTHGSGWLAELKRYIQGNILLVDSFLKDNLPDVHLTAPQGTYLLWLDFSSYGLSQTELDQRVIENAGLWLDSGTMFGAGGHGFQRINIACPRATLHEALERLFKAFH
jgi:cystathionine beta-lyase